MRLIPVVEAESKKVKVVFKQSEDITPQLRGVKGKIVSRHGSPHYPASEKDAVVYDVVLGDGSTKKNVPGRHLERV
jgi:hypothetical protein